MRIKLLFLLIIFSAGTFISFGWKENNSTQTGEKQVELIKKKKKKRKKPKKKKKKSNTTKKTSKKQPLDSAQIAKQKKKADKRHEKNKSKLDKKQEKKAKELAKSQADRKTFDKCDSADVVRTSQDTLLLAKYIKIYRSLGGVCYIIHLQKMADLEQTSEGFYSVQIESSKDPRAPAAWQTYLYCPIGKPNGTVALLSPEGDTVQMCTYANEKKNGVMYYVKKGKGVIYKEKYVDDVKIWEKKEDDEGN